MVGIEPQTFRFLQTLPLYSDRNYYSAVWLHWYSLPSYVYDENYYVHC